MQVKLSTKNYSCSNKSLTKLRTLWKTSPITGGLSLGHTGSSLIEPNFLRKQAKSAQIYVLRRSFALLSKVAKLTMRVSLN